MPIRDFDELLNERLAQPVEDRQFQLRGYTFTLRASIRPDAMPLFVAIGNSPDDVAGAEAVRAFMAAVLQDEGELAWWDELRDREGEDALTIADMVSVAGFALERIVGRPPTRLPDSGQTSEATPPITGSRAASPLRVAGSRGSASAKS
jgi:hypothetical protein